jgi:hypothetical protein
MTIVVQNNGEGDALEYFVNRAAPQNLVLRLYTNNITPAETDTAGTYTEAAGFGYASITLTGASWGAPSEGAPSSIAHAEQTFTFTGALGNVYGLFCTRASSGRIALSERFAGAPVVVTNNGDTIKVTPQVTAD